VRVELICGREKYMATISVVPFRIFVREDLKREKALCLPTTIELPKTKKSTIPSSPRLAPRQRLELSKVPQGEPPPPRAPCSRTSTVSP